MLRCTVSLCDVVKKVAPAPQPVEPAAWKELTAGWTLTPPPHSYASVGCLECRMTGYTGRMGIYETMVMTPELRKAISDETDLDALRDRAFREGMKPLRIAGAMKIQEGVTTADEVLKVTAALGMKETIK